MLTDLKVSEFLDETASNSPAPGGGSIAALAASLGASLISMVCRLTIGKKKYADVQSEMETILAKSEKLRGQFTAIVDEDTQAFNAVMAAFALPKTSEEFKTLRAAAIQEATKQAAKVPLKLMKLCSEGIDLIDSLIMKGNQNSLSDAGVAALMFRSACEGAALNVAINLNSIHDASFVEQMRKETERYKNRVSASVEQISRDVASRFTL
jgi:formiminotetrahydrofolate cyclodeaminase